MNPLASGIGLRPAVDSYIRPDKRAQQPGPDCALMIGGVAAPLVSAIVRTIVGMAGTKGAQPEWSEQLALHHLENGAGALGSEHRMVQAERENLVRTNGSVGHAVVVHNVVKAA